MMSCLHAPCGDPKRAVALPQTMTFIDSSDELVTQTAHHVQIPNTFPLPSSIREYAHDHRYSGKVNLEMNYNISNFYYNHDAHCTLPVTREGVKQFAISRKFTNPAPKPPRPPDVASTTLRKRQRTEEQKEVVPEEPVRQRSPSPVLSDNSFSLSSGGDSDDAMSDVSLGMS